MRKFISVLAVLIFAFSVQLMAQTTDPSTVLFKIKKYDAYATSGEPYVTATMWFNPDTMKQDLSIQVTVTEVVDSTHVNLGCVLTQGKRTVTRKTLTNVRTDAELWLPDTDWASGAPDSLFSIVLVDTRPLVLGESFVMEIKETDELQTDKYYYLKTTTKQSALFEDWR